MRKVLIESSINYVEVANEAAFYGPKIDVQVWSAIGREFTIATNQVDFAVPVGGRPQGLRPHLFWRASKSGEHSTSASQVAA
jgi:hypothetical protein